MSNVADVMERREIPAIATFHKTPREDKKASLAAGRYVAVDVDMVHVTPPYSKDLLKFKVETWFADMEQQVKNQRLPQEWLDMYRRQYKAWQEGQELPPDGTPIRGWGVISPAQQETLIAMKVLTVESLALMNDQGVQAMGMGGLELKNKAQAWITTMKDKGPVVIENARLKSQVASLESSVKALEKQVAELKGIVQLKSAVEGTKGADE